MLENNNNPVDGSAWAISKPRGTEGGLLLLLPLSMLET